MTLPHYIKVIARRLFAGGVAAAVVGLYLGLTDGFDNLAWFVTVAGAIGAVVFGIVWFVVRDADSHLR